MHCVCVLCNTVQCPCRRTKQTWCASTQHRNPCVTLKKPNQRSRCSSFGIMQVLRTTLNTSLSKRQEFAVVIVCVPFYPFTEAYRLHSSNVFAKMQSRRLRPAKRLAARIMPRCSLVLIRPRWQTVQEPRVPMCSRHQMPL